MIRLACCLLLLSSVYSGPVQSPGTAPTAEDPSVYDYDFVGDDPVFDYADLKDQFDKAAKKVPAEEVPPKINKLINSQAFRNLFSVKPLCDDHNVDCARNVVYHFDLMGLERGERPNAAHY